MARILQTRFSTQTQVLLWISSQAIQSLEEMFAKIQ